LDKTNFKKVEKGDYQDIADLFNYYIKNSTAIGFYDPLTTPEVISYFNIEAPTTRSFCIYTDGTFCGFCQLQQYSVKKAYIYTHEITIYLKPEFMGKGIGSQAVLFLEDAGRKQGIKTIVAGICSENTESIGLFEKHDYVKCGHFKKMVYKFDRFMDNIYYQKHL
jgi:L-amino acid N-acyltransferase YncA